MSEGTNEPKKIDRRTFVAGASLAAAAALSGDTMAALGAEADPEWWRKYDILLNEFQNTEVTAIKNWYWFLNEGEKRLLRSAFDAYVREEAKKGTDFLESLQSRETMSRFVNEYLAKNGFPKDTAKEQAVENLLPHLRDRASMATPR